MVKFIKYIKDKDNMHGKYFDAHEVAKITGTTVRQINYWADKGLLNVERSGVDVSNNRHLYTEEHIEPIRDIALMMELGMNVSEVKEILDASELERLALFEEYAYKLKSQYDRLLARIRVADIVSCGGIESLTHEASLFSNAKSLIDSYARDENLHTIARWHNSHTERDIDCLVADLSQVAKDFDLLDKFSSWPEVELVLVRFCDIWASRFGWPTVGDMLQLSFLFSDEDSRNSEVLGFIEVDVKESMSRAFLLAWISALVETLDAALINLYTQLGTIKYKKLTARNVTSKKSLKALSYAAQVFEAIICECSGHAHICDAPSSNERVNKISEVSAEVFAFLEETLLDDTIDEYLNLDEFTTIDESSLKLVSNIVTAYNANNLGNWVKAEGSEELILNALGWKSVMYDFWLEFQLNNMSERKYKSWAANTSDFDKQKQFATWLNEWISHNYEDFPEPHWATEDECCVKERLNRQLLQTSK